MEMALSNLSANIEHEPLMGKDFCFPSPLNRSKCPLLLTFWHSFHFIFYNAMEIV